MKSVQKAFKRTTRQFLLSSGLVLIVALSGCEKSPGPAIGDAYEAAEEAAENSSAPNSDAATSGAESKAATENDAATSDEASEQSSPWKLVWSDEFESDQLDTDKWKFETGATGWGNKEWQDYTDGENVKISDGTLKIIARKTGAGQKVGDYTSTRLNSKFDFTYGRVEVRARMPEVKGNGLWPAIWTLGRSLHQGAGWPNCGELDIVEYLSFMPGTVQTAIHTKANNHVDKTQVQTGPMDLKGCEENFHVYGVVWTQTRIDFFIDDPSNITLSFERPEKFNADNWPFDKPQYLLMNLAVGGWGGTEGVDDSIFPSEMEFDYVRIYQAK